MKTKTNFPENQKVQLLHKTLKKTLLDSLCQFS